MRMFTRLFALICILALLGPLSTAAFAFETPNYDGILLERGYPEEVIAALCENAKEHLVILTGYEYVGSTSVGFSESTGQYAIRTESEMMLADTISADDLLITCVFSYNASTKKLAAIVNYEWLNLPFFRYQDPMSISWNENVGLTYDYTSFHKEDLADGHTKDPNGVTHIYTGWTQSESYVEYDSNDVGVMWFADLAATIFNVDALYGYASMEFFCDSNPYGKTVYINYVHPQALNTGSAYLKENGDVGMDGGVFDRVGVPIAISW